MKKHIIAFLAAIFIFTSSTMDVSAHYDTAYWNDTTYQTDRSKWMNALPDTVRLSEMSIPGTHDSMAHKANLDSVDNTRTQSLSLEDQLKAGIRYIDIRLKYSENSFDIHHGIVYVGYNFDDVLTTVQRFLRENPSETVLMRLKQEHTRLL